MAVATYVGSFTKATATGNQDIAIPVDLTAAAAGSWAIMFWTSGPNNTASGAWGANVNATLGFTTGAANSYAIGNAADDNVATSNTGRRMAAKCITFADSGGVSVLAEADFVSFPDATHMRLNWTANNGGLYTVNFVIFTGLTGAKAINWTTSASGAGTKSVTGAGFKPDLVFHATTILTAMPSSGVAASLSFGAMNKHGQQWANAVFSDDGVNPSNTSRWQQTDACLLTVGPTEGTTQEGSFQSMDADGFSIYWSTQALTGTREYISLCLGGVSSKIGGFAAAGTSPQAIDTRHGFTARGALFSSTSAGQQASPASFGLWNLGAFDGTNSRAVGLADRDGVTPTNAKSVWLNDAAIFEGNGAATPGTAGKGTVAFTSTSQITATWSTAPSGDEILYLLIGDAGTNTFPTKVETSGVRSAATAYSNQKHALTTSNGVQWMIRADDTAHGYPYYSTDGGVTWTYDSTGGEIAGWLNGSIAAYVDSGGTERLVAVWKQTGTGGGRTDLHTYVMVGAFNAGRTTLTWGSAVDVSSGTTLFNYADLVAHAEGTGGKAHLVMSYADAVPKNTTNYYPVTIDSSGVPTVGALVEISPTYASGGYGVNVHTYPSIDVNPSTKDLYVAWSAGKTGAGFGLRFRKAAYSAGVWTWGTEREIDNTLYEYSTSYSVICRWNPAQGDVYIGAAVYSGSATFHNLYKRDAADTTTTSYVIAGSGGGWFGSGMTVDANTGDVYIVGRSANTVQGLFYVKWTRSTTSVGSGVLTDENGNSAEPFAYAWFSGITVRWVYTAGNNSPYAVKYDQLVLNTTPTIAYGAASLADASVQSTATPTLTVYVTDPDPAQTDTVTFEVATDAGFSSIIYTGTATAATPTSSTAVSKLTSALTKGVTLYWRARVSDGFTTSANTATRTFTIYDNPTVAIGASTPSALVSTGGPTLAVGWTYAQAQGLAQATYRVVVTNAAATITYYDSGVLSGTASSLNIDAVANNIPTDTTATALLVTVTVTAATSGASVGASKGFDIQWGVVTVAITTPGARAIVATTSLTATWTFASTRGKTQGSYRIRLLIAASGAVLLDTGFVASALTSVPVAFALVDGSTYTLEVTAKNSEGVVSS